MDKISSQKFNVNAKNSDVSKADNVLGALFSMPIIADEKKVNGKKIDEFIVNPSIEKILNSKNFDNSNIFFKPLLLNHSKSSVESSL